MSMQSLAEPPDFEPVFAVVTTITPFALTANPETYWVASVEQPAVSASAGHAVLVETYSLTEVLHAAEAATPSDIFERIT